MAASKLKAWGEANGFAEQSLIKLAATKVSNELNKKPLYKILSDGTQNYKVWAKNPIEHPLPPSDKGYFIVDCTTDISSYPDDYVANMILKVTDRPTSNFMQMIRRRLSVLERPLVKQEEAAKAIFMQTLIQSMLKWLSPSFERTTIFCLRTKSKGNNKRLTPAQHLGIVNKQFSLNDILYFK